MRNKKYSALQIITLTAFAFLCLRPPAGHAEVKDADPRDAAVDRALGNMEEGSRILPPGSLSGGGQGQKIPGSGLSPGMDARATSSAPAAGAGAIAGSAAGTGGAQTIASSDIPLLSTAGEGSNPIGTVNESSGGTDSIPAGPEEPGSGGGSGGLDSGGAGTGDRSIVELDAGLDTSGGGVDANVDASLDTNAGGGLLDANLDSQTSAGGAGLEAQIETIEDTALIDTILDMEEGATDTAVGGEADVGVEADIEGSGEGDEALNDAASGLL